MTTPSISGKVLDASALAALVKGRLSVLTWIDIARVTGTTLYIPTLALSEVRSVRPDAGPILADLLTHPSVVLGELDADLAAAVDELLEQAGVFDALAGHIAVVARRRDWPVISDDPGRLQRIDPDLGVDPV